MHYGASRCRLRQARSSACWDPTATGKSTLVKIMMTVIRPTCWLALPGCFAVVIFERRSALLGEPSGGSILWSYPPRGEG